jgi:phosphatidylglycerophosphate synthase
MLDEKAFFATINQVATLSLRTYGMTVIVFQYITDLLDGEIGRKRNTGLIKWGFYMDQKKNEQNS